MAEPNDTPFDPSLVPSSDTPITQASTNPNRNNTRYHPQFAALLQTLLDNHASAPPTPVPPKHCRPKRIRPRRRVTVGTDLATASPPAVPRIRLCGRWLAIAGFDVHTRVRVHVAKGILILIPEDAHINEVTVPLPPI
jgi:hypothetical protein